MHTLSYIFCSVVNVQVYFKSWKYDTFIICLLNKM